MAKLRFLTIQFVDGSTVRYSFPAQTDSKTARQMKLEQFFKDRFLIVQGDGKLTVYPLANIRSLELSAEEAEFQDVRIPAHSIIGASRLS